MSYYSSSSLSSDDDSSDGDMPAFRMCAACHLMKSADNFSNNQWRKGPGASRCTSCVNGYDPSFLTCSACGSVTSDFSAKQSLKGQGVARCRSCVKNEHYATTRCNHSTSASINYSCIFSSGGFRDVYKGYYIGGIRSGKACVVKVFRNRSLKSCCLSLEQKIMEAATNLVHDWNNHHPKSYTIQVNQPATIDTPLGLGLMEPFINAYTKWNSNSGHVFENCLSNMMQALSHYSYHTSGGQYVLCDLQGGTNGCGNIILTDPVLMSQDGRFGPTDLGAAGIRQFFSHHRCNQWCKRHWHKPHVPFRKNNAFPVVAGTTMA